LLEGQRRKRGSQHPCNAATANALQHKSIAAKADRGRVWPGLIERDADRLVVTAAGRADELIFRDRHPEMVLARRSGIVIAPQLR